MRVKDTTPRGMQPHGASTQADKCDNSIAKDFERGTFWMAVIVVLAFGLMMLGAAIWDL